jgi:hypothetical protein
MALTSKEVDICYQALDVIGAKVGTFTVDLQTGNVGVKCNRHYAQTRKELNRDFEWPFATKRVKLSAETKTPDFGFDYQHKLPKDYARLKLNDSVEDSQLVDERFEIEGDYLLSDDSEVNIVYIRNVTDPDEFDPLFTRILILRLALKLRPTIAGTKTNRLYENVKDDLELAESQARLVCRAETNTSGRSDWLQSRDRKKVGNVVTDGEERS